MELVDLVELEAEKNFCYYHWTSKVGSFDHFGLMVRNCKVPRFNARRGFFLVRTPCDKCQFRTVTELLTLEENMYL